MKIFTIVGARPQFIKASVVSMEMKKNSSIEEVIIHTGQHFDPNMSDVFFEELGIPRPSYNLNISGGLHGEMTGRMLTDIEALLLENRPDILLVYGDTNSTLSGALAAAKLGIPVAHIEAGLRSFNMSMPEEINRILTDQISSYLYCPTQVAVDNLKNEGFDKKNTTILKAGDVMQDSAEFFAQKAVMPKQANLDSDFILATIHRAENTDSQNKLMNIVKGLNWIHENIAPVLLPLHPRTKKMLSQYNLELKVNTIDPVGYFEMLWLLKSCKMVLTDSGGVQKEAFFMKKQCITLREETEWVELVDTNVNVLVGSDFEKLIESVKTRKDIPVEENKSLYGGGQASHSIVQHLLSL